MPRLFALAVAICGSLSLCSNVLADLRAGAAVVDISPTQMPVLVNGGMMSRSADSIKTTVNARAIVVDDGKDRIAIVVVDSCMVPRELLDDAKLQAAQVTQIKPDHILVSATHTHTAPSAFGALGTDPDLSYLPLLRQKIVEAIVQAESHLQPARVGWGETTADEFTALRRWVRRPDRLDVDPFGNQTVRANMHAARDPENVIGESGPEDPELSIIAFQSTDGDPIAILCNFSMHYFGDQPISADYFGLFSDGIAQHAASKQSDGSKQDVVGIMSHGCSGDIWRRDYMTWTGKDEATIESYTQGLLQIAKDAYDGIEYQADLDVAMAESRLRMSYRVPDAQRLQWAQQIVDQIEDGVPKDREQVYAREQVLLHQMQETEIVVQALKLGNLAIVTTPNETYALTGLKLKLQSPLEHTMVIELANGADGYIPPPEQHHLGGYNTWAARSAGLEVQAEPRIVAAGLHLLETISGQPRRQSVQKLGPAATAILSQKPLLYWRLDEMEASVAVDASGNHHDGVFEPGVLFFLPGPLRSTDDELFTLDQPNRAVHTANGRIRARLDSLGQDYTVLMSFWNGMPVDARETAGWLFSRDHAHSITSRGDHLGLGGEGARAGKLIFQHGVGGEPSVGKTPIERWTWNQVALVRQGDRVRVFLNDNPEPEIDVQSPADSATTIASCFFGGRSDNDSNWEGRIDEVAVFDRALTVSE
ncbi:MAG: hypothetical protein HKN47_17690 [Pirellulaceae bacterium]|nr:hypothetical protein [Pirellulaceae bacterium]